MHPDPQDWKTAVRQFYAKGDLCAALETARTAFSAHPDDPEAAHALGVLCLATGALSDAVELFRRLVQSDGSAERRFDLAVAFEASGDLASARAAYTEALRDTPGHFASRLNLCALLQTMRLPEAALEQANILTAMHPGNAQAWCALGHACFAGFDPSAAQGAFAQALKLAPDHLPAQFGHALALAMCGNLEAAARTIRQLRDLNLPADIVSAIPQAAETLVLSPEDLQDIHVTALFERARRGEWACYPVLGNALSRLVGQLNEDPTRKIPKAFAFYALALGIDYAAYRTLARRAASTETSDTVPMAHEAESCVGVPDRRIRIGYISPAFRHHPSAYLVRDMFRHHDRSRFEVMGYCIGTDDQSPARLEIMRGCDRFVSLAGLSDEEAAQQIRADRIDILVQLEGFLDGTRNRIPALRPAPLRVAHVGIVGALDAAYVDYRLSEDFGDQFDRNEESSLEQPVVFRDLYSPYGAPSAPWSVPVSRESYGLPAKAFVFCSFNNDYKIEPAVFAAWMEVLHATPESVLWLRATHERLWEQCCTAAAEQGIPAARIIRALDEDNDRHLARLRLADLMLDTFVCNAHTTALDSLWMGLPVITRTGRTPASSLCSVFLKHLGLGTLIHPTTEAYIAGAVRLACDPEHYRETQRKLAQARTATPVFDTAYKVRLYEAAYERMWARHCAGQAPAAFVVAEGTAPSE